MYVRNDHGLGTAADIHGDMFHMDSTAGSTDNRYEAMTIQGFNNFFYASTSTSPAIEGQIFDGIAVVECQNGIIWVNSASGGYVPPQLQFLNGHMNCFQSWLQASGVAQVKMIACTLELNSKFGDTTAGVTLTNVSDPTLAELEMYFTQGSRAASAIVLSGSNTNQAKIHDITGVAAGSPYFIQVLSGVQQTSVDKIQVASAAQIVNDAGTNTWLGGGIRINGQQAGGQVSAAGFFIVNTTQSLATYPVDIPLPAGRFLQKPVCVVCIGAEANAPMYCNVDNGNTSVSSIRVNLKRADAQAIPSGNSFRLHYVAMGIG